MSSTELVPVSQSVAIEDQNEQRTAALERLGAEVETAAAERAYEIMVEGRLIAQALVAARKSLKDARLAGKASVLGARKVGKLLLDQPNDPISLVREEIRRPGRPPSMRTLLARELEISRTTVRKLCGVASVADPDFQRYIQREDIIPSVNGLLSVHSLIHKKTINSSYQNARRRKVGVKTPSHPSLDEAHSLIVRALGHLGGLNGNGTKVMIARGLAMENLYAAEEQLKPFTSGYGKK